MKDEKVEVVDKDNNLLEVVGWKEAVSRKLRFRVTKVLVFDTEGNLILQKRSDWHSIFPNTWDIGVGETLNPGESFLECAERGVREEYGAEPQETQHLFDLPIDDGDHLRYFGVFSCTINTPVHFEEKEISEVKALKPQDIPTFIENNPFTPSGNIIFEKYET